MHKRCGTKNPSPLLIRGSFDHQERCPIRPGHTGTDLHALEEADILLFVGDGKAGLHPEDSALFDILRRTSKPLFFAVNKIDGPEQQKFLADFYAFRVQDIYPISSAHGFGIGDLLSDMVKLMPDTIDRETCEEGEVSEIRVSILGRPNVGKSTLVNEFSAPRESLSALYQGQPEMRSIRSLQRDAEKYMLIDTAGIEKKGKGKGKSSKK